MVVDRCCGLSKLWNGEEGQVLQGMWLVLLKSTKNWFSGVDPLRTTGAATCPVWNDLLTIRDAIGSVSCSVAWGRAQCLAWDPHGARGVSVWKH
jgi:hypothetical protein